VRARADNARDATRRERERPREIRAARRPAPIGDEETLLASRGRREVCCVPATDEGVRLPPFESPSGAPGEARRAETGDRSIASVPPVSLFTSHDPSVVISKRTKTKEERRKTDRRVRPTDRPTVRPFDRPFDGSTDGSTDRPTDRRAPAIDPIDPIDPSESSR